MSRKGPEQSTVLLINVGVTIQDASPNLVQLETIKSIVKRLIDKLIFKNPKDEIAILLMERADEIRNPEKKYITVCAPMAKPSFEMVNIISNLEGTNHVCNWLFSLYDAVEYLMENGYVPTRGSKYKPLKKIIMISDFKENAAAINIPFRKNLLSSVLETKIHLIALGEENLYEKDDNSLTPSDKTLRILLKKVTGQFLTFNELTTQLLYYNCPYKKQNRWLADLELGSLRIPIAAYIKVKPFDKFPHWKRTARKNQVATRKQFFDRHHNPHIEEEKIKGYKWAGVFQAVTDEYLKRLKYVSGPQSYKIYGFTKRTNVSLDLWCDGSTRVIVPASQNPVKEFYSLVEAMRRNDSIAIVRKVYCRNRTPTMVALYPCVDVPEEPWCLVEVTLPYAETHKMLVKKSIRSMVKSATNEQRECVEQLLSKLTLKPSESEEPFAFPGTVHNPTIQHRYHMLSYRALNPNKPLPEMEDYLKKSLDSPIEKEKIKGVLDEINTVFDLKKTMSWRKRKVEEESQPSTSKMEKLTDPAKETPKLEKLPVSTQNDTKCDHLWIDLIDDDMEEDDWGYIAE